MADRSYKLTLSLSDGSTINAGTITAPQGPNGANGATFTPSVSAAGVLSWTNNGGLANPSPISIKGPKGDDAVITASDVENWGFTKNTGTITEIKMNGVSKGKSGVVDLGTVLTAHTGLVGGNLVQYDSSAQTLKDSGKKISDLATASQVNAKYTKPSGGIPKTDLASDVQTSLGKADNAMPKSGGTFTGEVKFGSTENFQGYYIKRMLGSLGAGTAYANLDSSYKDGTWHRMWRLRFPSGSSFWGKIKVTLYGDYSSFNASGLMSKSITCNFNTSNIYNNVGCYDGLGVNVEQDFRISEAIWNATASAWEILIWQQHLNGNNPATIMLECWTKNNTNYIKAFNGIAAQVVELTQSTSYSAQKASSTGGTKTVTWATLPVYENPLGEEIATVAMLEDKQDKITSSNKLSSSLVDGLGAAAAKAVDTAITANSTSTNLPTSKAVEDRINAHSGIDKVGTVTAIKINDATKNPASGVVDLGTFLTAQDISGLQDKLTTEQLNAVNSGITAAKVSTYDGYATSKQDKLSTAQLGAVNSGITAAKVSTYDGYADKITALEGKPGLDKVGTVTGVKMNETTKNPSSGVVDLGTVLTDASKFATAAQGTKADNAVPNTRKVNNKALSSDITLGAADVGVTETAFPGLKKTGTVTGVKMNGTTKNPSSGVVDLGTVITAHQSLDGKQDKITSSNKLAASLVSGLAKVATSGSYNDLSNKPTIPTVNNGTLTIKKNGTTVATFSANQSGNATANITVPTFSLSGTTLTITV